MSARRTVIVLLGPKGAGKTYVGTLVQRELGVRFVRAEPIFLEHQRTSTLTGVGRDAAGYDKVLSAVEDVLARESRVCFESTGASPAFAPFLEQLRARYDVRVVGVRAPLDRCAERVRTRDRSQHITVSDHRVTEINARAAEVAIPCDVEIDNGAPAPDHVIVGAIWGVLARPRPG